MVAVASAADSRRILPDASARRSAPPYGLSDSSSWEYTVALMFVPVVRVWPRVSVLALLSAIVIWFVESPNAFNFLGLRRLWQAWRKQATFRLPYSPATLRPSK